MSERRRIHRKIERTPEERAELERERSFFHQGRPTLEDLLASGQYTEPISQVEYLARLRSTSGRDRGVGGNGAAGSRDADLTVQSHGLKGQEISWAGGCPWTGGLCLGTDGGVIAMPIEGVGMQEPDLWHVAREPINGVAFAGDFIGVSTPAEVVLLRRDPSTGDIGRVGEPFGGGAHGIVATASGTFLAPLDGDRLLEMACDGRGHTMGVVHFSQDSLNLYKLAGLGVVDGEEVFACAARKGGLLTFASGRGQIHPPIIRHPLAGLDLVGVCPLGSPGHPRAVAGLGADGTLVFCRDIREGKFTGLRFDGLRVVAYELLAARGHLFVLTRDSLLALPGLATRFLEGQPLAPTPAIEVPIRGSDAFLLPDAIGLIVGGRLDSCPIASLIDPAAQIKALPARASVELDSGRLPDSGGWPTRREVLSPVPSDFPWDAPLSLSMGLVSPI